MRAHQPSFTERLKLETLYSNFACLQIKLFSRCFEVNKCPGLYWQGKKACSPKVIKAAQEAVKPFKVKPTKAPATMSATTLPTKAPVTIPTVNLSTKTPKKPSKINLPTRCLLAIVRCCDSKQTAFLPFRCFEVNRCPGLFWVGRKACSSKIFTLATNALVPR